MLQTSVSIGLLYLQGLQPSKSYGKTAMGNLQLEMYTVLCQIEAILISRPITTISDDAKYTVHDDAKYTPSMLLYGFKSTQLTIVADLTIDEKCPRKQFNYLQKLIAEFWKFNI